MHYDKSLFTDYHPLKHHLYIGGISSGLKAVGVGEISIKDPNSNTHTFKSVLHILKLKCGLMSLNTLDLLGWASTITKTECTFSDGNSKSTVQSEMVFASRVKVFPMPRTLMHCLLVLH